MSTDTTSSMETSDLEYAGFWIRVWASLIDTVLWLVLLGPILTWVYGPGYWGSSGKMVQGPIDFLLTWVFPAAVVVVFWSTKQATPGKMAIAAKIVDARTGGKLSTTQTIVRYVGYFVSTLFLFLGFVWVAFDARKQGWHDKLAGTVVVRRKGGNSESVQFERG